MASRTITITDAAYARLAQEKKAGESFTDVILRLTKPKAVPLSEVHRRVPRELADALAEAHEEMRRERRARREQRLGRRYGGEA